MDDELENLRRLSFMASRIPALDALEAFVPTGAERDPVVEAATRLTGFSRWFPVEGGHRVLVLYEGGDYDASRLSLVAGAWDHEHCKRCGTTIQATALCYVTTSGPYIVLCPACHQLLSSKR